jgi:hypothetical protein
MGANAQVYEQRRVAATGESLGGSMEVDRTFTRCTTGSGRNKDVVAGPGRGLTAQDGADHQDQVDAIVWLRSRTKDA